MQSWKITGTEYIERCKPTIGWEDCMDRIQQVTILFECSKPSIDEGWSGMFIIIHSKLIVPNFLVQIMFGLPGISI